MAGWDDIRNALVVAPVRPVHLTLVRCVALLPLTADGTLDYLFTSGKANRYNPAGVFCIYLSEDEKTARAEYGRRLGPAALQPVGTFFAEARLAGVLDLADAQTRQSLGLNARDLSIAWPRARKPTRTQLLGLAISQQNTISANPKSPGHCLTGKF